MFIKIIEDQMEFLRNKMSEMKYQDGDVVDNGQVEEITEEDKEKINDVIDTEDLGAKADYEWAKEKDSK